MSTEHVNRALRHKEFLELVDGELAGIGGLLEDLRVLDGGALLGAVDLLEEGAVGVGHLAEALAPVEEMGALGLGVGHLGGVEGHLLDPGEPFVEL